MLSLGRFLSIETRGFGSPFRRCRNPAQYREQPELVERGPKKRGFRIIQFWWPWNLNMSFWGKLWRLLEDRIGWGSCCFRSSTLKTFEYISMWLPQVACAPRSWANSRERHGVMLFFPLFSLALDVFFGPKESYNCVEDLIKVALYLQL